MGRREEGEARVGGEGGREGRRGGMKRDEGGEGGMESRAGVGRRGRQRGRGPSEVANQTANIT